MLELRRLLRHVKDWFVRLSQDPAAVMAAQAATVMLSDSVDTSPEHALIKGVPALTLVGIGYVGQPKLEGNVKDVADRVASHGVTLDQIPEIALRAFREAAVIADKERRHRLANALVNFARTPPQTAPSTSDADQMARPWPPNEDVMTEACLRAATELTTLEVEILATVDERMRTAPPLAPRNGFMPDEIWDALWGRRPQVSREAYLAGLAHVAALGLLEQVSVWGGYAYTPNQLTYRFLATIREPS